uniref:Uncharacterized protein n=1 Tax=Aplanochytrium stocchinoi TaxID=215587 RepID=A0A7S3PMA5_9STRA|mmetsp:Transcript_334/g.379  ORF Transcript_334/g.379 Transcript_334/m.379 type:complete len:144 (+) Transcript_334:123-554(+)
MDSTTLLDYSRKLLFVEAYTNIFLFGPLMFMFPKLLLDPQYGENETPGVAAYEVFSWFGAMTVGGSFFLLRSLQNGGQAEKIALQSFLIMDCTFLPSFMLVRCSKLLNAANVFNLVYGVALMIARIIILSLTSTTSKTSKNAP